LIITSILNTCLHDSIELFRFPILLFNHMTHCSKLFARAQDSC